MYLNYLLSLFLGRGGRVVRTAIQHISQAADGSFIPKAASDQSSNQVASAVIVCSGLGARSLGGVEDKDVHPIRGQTVLIRAPWVRFGRTLSGSHENDMWTYVIPRRSGDVSMIIRSFSRSYCCFVSRPLGRILSSLCAREMFSVRECTNRRESETRLESSLFAHSCAIC